MGKLRYLVVGPEGTHYGQDCNSSQTNNLECLSGIHIREDRDVEMLKCSPHLRILKCYTLAGKCSLDLRFLTQLESLNTKFLVPKLSPSFPSNLKKLTLSLCDFAWEEMSIIGRLDNLEVLKVYNLSFFSSERGIWKTTEGEFQKLKFLKLEKVYNLIQWNVASSQHFPNLQRLILIDCRRLQEIPLEIGEITALEMLEIKGKLLESLVDSVNSIQKEQREMGNEDLSVIMIDCTVWQPTNWLEERSLSSSDESEEVSSNSSGINRSMEKEDDVPPQEDEEMVEEDAGREEGSFDGEEDSRTLEEENHTQPINHSQRIISIAA